MKITFRNFRITDAFTDTMGSVTVNGGRIVDVSPESEARPIDGLVFDGGGRLVLTSGFVDMHAHFREPGFSEKETLESASLAAARGGYTSVVCMANTKPPVDNEAAAYSIKRRADTLGLTRLYPAISLTEGMNGKKLSPYLEAEPSAARAYSPPLLSEDGKDVEDDGLFSAALRRAAEGGHTVSCHCDLGGEDAAVDRALRLGAGCRVHIAHVSTKGAAELLRHHKKRDPRTLLTAETTPHHIALTCRDAATSGPETFGKVAPPLRGEEDRLALIEALKDGVIDVIATDHAPHTTEDKLNGAPGFSGLETAFTVCYSTLVKRHNFSPQKLFSLLSAAPARILGLSGHGAIAAGNNADIVILDTECETLIDSAMFASRGKNTLFSGRKLYGAVVLTLCGGRVVYQSPF
ncbi:MAG: dihydroorotase [Spirochaetaceae bacterium]|nr:dihydroorotase [Spirochaetaceae bacterium]